MKRPPEDQRIDCEEYKAYINSGLVNEVSAKQVNLNGQQGIEFSWQLSEKTSLLVRRAVVDFLSVAAFGEKNETGTAYNERLRTINIILYGKKATDFQINFFGLNQSQQAR